MYIFYKNLKQSYDNYSFNRYLNCIISGISSSISNLVPFHVLDTDIGHSPIQTKIDLEHNKDLLTNK